ncbi:hypothetical protein A2U01_0013693 [Trifolium medium]|uniref:Transmembrane protein n=1 Tax=Trifolium medium TaxID=97028 RepID=A0A392MYZ6_9FABA|nr:hypothetical protein [Trifolium medium]
MVRGGAVGPLHHLVCSSPPSPFSCGDVFASDLEGSGTTAMVTAEFRILFHGVLVLGGVISFSSPYFCVVVCYVGGVCAGDFPTVVLSQGGSDQGVCYCSIRVTCCFVRRACLLVLLGFVVVLVLVVVGHNDFLRVGSFASSDLVLLSFVVAGHHVIAVDVWL